MKKELRTVNFIGSDARTHAMVWHTANFSDVEEIYCAPGNAGIAQERLPNGRRVTCVSIPVNEIERQLAFAKAVQADVTIVSPEAPLVSGVADLFEASGQKLFGCNRVAAQFEGSKVFAQKFAQKHGVKFAPGECFSGAGRDAAKAYARSLNGRCVVKADGLRGGKGVAVCHSFEEAEAAIDAELKNVDSRIVIQEFLEGREVSLMLFCDGKTVKFMETAQDYKRALDGDKGGMTGGMGSYSSEPLLNEQQLADVRRTIIEPWLAGCEAEGIVFKGVLYIGLMVTQSGIFALEFNVRLGDPEAEVLLPRLENDFLEIVDACISGTLDTVTLRFRPIHSLCVVMAAPGYPEKTVTGQHIHGLERCEGLSNLKVFYAGTSFSKDGVVTSGGRVLAVTAWSKKDLRHAAHTSYIATGGVLRFDGAHFRSDIGKHIWKNL